MPADFPNDYGDAAAEYAAVRTHAGLVDRGDWGVVELTGRDRVGFLHALLSNDVKSLAPGQGCAATLLDVHGKVQVLLDILVLEDRLLLLLPPGTAHKTLEALDHYLFSEKVALTDVSAGTRLWLVAGPEAPALVERVAGARPSDAAWAHVAGALDGVALRLVRGARETGEAEVWVLAPAAEAGRAREALVAAGARPVGATALESLRIEAGTPVLGRDVDDTVLLPEIPSAGLVSHTKGCYPGQEVVVRIRDRGHVNRLLTGLVLDGDAVPEPGAELLAEGAAAGRVTSATRSLGLGRPIALAFVRRQLAEPGTAVGVRVGAATVPARVAALPFTR